MSPSVMIWASTSSDGDGLQNSLLNRTENLGSIVKRKIRNPNKGKLTLKLKGPVKKLGLQKPLSTDRLHATPH